MLVAGTALRLVRPTLLRNCVELNRFELYNLKNDIAESRELSKSEPSVFERSGGRCPRSIEMSVRKPPRGRHGNGQSMNPARSSGRNTEAESRRRRNDATFNRRVQVHFRLRNTSALGVNSTASSSGKMGRAQFVCPRLFRLALVDPGASTLINFSHQLANMCGSQ